jgi:hypothetical protein
VSGNNDILLRHYINIEQRHLTIELAGFP